MTAGHIWMTTGLQDTIGHLWMTTGPWDTAVHYRMTTGHRKTVTGGWIPQETMLN